MASLIQSVSRALFILNILAAHPHGLTIKEIVGITNLNVSTIYHLVNTLKAEGYIVGVDNGTYRLGGAIPRLYSAFVATIQPDERLLDALRTLATVTRETTYVGAWQNGEVIIQAIVEGSQALRVGGLQVGYGGHTYARASGKLLLAYLDGQELDKYLANHSLAPLTRYTVRTEEDLRNQLEQIRVRGYAIDREEFAADVCCVAAPVFSAEGKPVAALTVSAPTWRFMQNEQELVSLVAQAAHDVSTGLGFRQTLAHESIAKAHGTS